MKRTILALAAGGLLLTGCSSSDDTSQAPTDGAPSSSEPAAPNSSVTSSTATSPSSVASAALGVPSTNGGVTLTVNSVQETDTLSYREGTSRDNYQPLSPRPNGKFVVINTTIVNDGAKSMDLTCGYPIRNTLYDIDKRQFDTIDSLYRVEGNPECNDNLQPGFDATMTYVYEVPAAADPIVFAFSDADVRSASPTLVELPAAGT